MSIRSSTAAGISTGLVIVTLLASACQQGPSPEMLLRLARADTALAQKDSLLQDIADYARFMSEVSTELAQVEVRGEQLNVLAESPRQATRDSMVAKLGYLTKRVSASDARLRESRRKIQGLTTISDSLRTTLEATIRNYEEIVRTQKESIARLNQWVDSLQTATVRLASEKGALEDTVGMLRTARDAAYYVIGTKDELVERGIIRKEGGARFLFVLWKRGETMIPADDLRAEDFIEIDRHDVKEIRLPSPDKQYRVASHQNLQFLAEPADDDRKVQGERIEITQPEEFWKPSPFLIIVES